MCLCFGPGRSADWQGTPKEHLSNGGNIDGYRGYANGNSDIEDGAYTHIYDYRNISVDHVEVHALGWSVTGGTIGTVETQTAYDWGSPGTFSGVTVERLILDNAGGVPGHYIFTNTGLSFTNVTVKSGVPSTRVTINDQTRSFGLSTTPGHLIELVDPGQRKWYLLSSNGSVTTFFYDNRRDIPFMGDWDCDGDDTPGLFRRSDAFAYLRSSNGQGNADRQFFFGNPSDVPMAWDFNASPSSTTGTAAVSTRSACTVSQRGSSIGGTR